MMREPESAAARTARRLLISRRRREFLAGCPRHPDTEYNPTERHELEVPGSCRMVVSYGGCGCIMVVRLDQEEAEPEFTAR